MPPVLWPWPEPEKIISDFGARHNSGKHTGLLMHALWTVDGLHYVAELDAKDDLSHGTINGYHADTLAVIHARWATGTCITVLDLCLAGLGRILCGHKKTKELSVLDFTPSPKADKRAIDITQRRDLLPQATLDWLDGLLADDGYKAVKLARNSLTHGIVRRHFFLPRRRLVIDVGGAPLDVPALIAISRDTAERYVRRLMEILPTI